MTIINTSHVEITTFFLVGIPGLEYAHIWISIPICSMYFVAILGNCTILFVIKKEPSLHEPMYYFLSMLALSDLGLSLSSLPTMLRTLLFNAPTISANTCFAQEFFIHGFTACESSVLLIMSFDRFLAIHNPLRYSSILTTVRVAQIGVVFSFKSFLLDVMKLACSDNQINVIYGFFVALCGMVDFILIVVSYILILKTVLGIASQKEQLKALNTCTSHICAVIIFYLPIINLAIVHRFVRHASPLFNVLMANILLLVPPLMNPIVYCIKTRQIRIRFVAKLCIFSCVMSPLNGTNIEVLKFLLTGIPGLEKSHIWIAIPFSSVYLLSLLGNFTILFFIKTEPSLHEPMYYFLSMLSISDLGLSLSSLPTTLGLFLFSVHEIHASACFAQDFCAICNGIRPICGHHNPLRYSTILTSSRVIKTGVLLTSKNVLLILPLPFLLQRLIYCHQNLLSHSYCLHQDVMKLACSDNRVNVVYGLFAALSTILDLLFITFSYIMILKTVLSIATPREQFKALNTCISHICAVLIFYAPMLSAAMLHRFARDLSPLIHILMADVFLLVPPLMNPIVYCVKTRQIREKVVEKLCPKRKMIKGMRKGIH
ncbi:hypothetical protein QTO34_003843 [Cnephaeus nilssonii]|uniref:G-protein coupled receptors family 1 profile domain-containing protein n=1 Tax=Cnephaeus nilssonii TaxID=3371016 RepID=A0AA40LLK1_CNENI|nr:hypothetical protein QTO34_003843 [Eptesicus nilssonii]